MIFPVPPLPVISNFVLPNFSRSEFQSGEGYRTSVLKSEVPTGAMLTLNYEGLFTSEAADLIRFWVACKGSHYKFRLPREIYELVAIAAPVQGFNIFLEEFELSPYWILKGEAPTIELSVYSIHNLRLQIENVR